MNKLTSNLLTSTLAIALSGASIGFNVEAATAQIIDLGFSLDSSGSVGATNWDLITEGLANALEEIPLSGVPQQYRISVVGFSDAAFDIVTPEILTLANLADIQDDIRNAPFTAGLTCISCSIDLLTSNLAGVGGVSDESLINISTDGAPNVGETDGVALRASTIADGWSGLSAEAIGTFDISFLEDLVFPQPPLITDDPDDILAIDPFDTGFILEVDNFLDYEAAIRDKVRAIPISQDVPEPGTVLGLLAISGLGLGLKGKKQS